MTNREWLDGLTNSELAVFIFRVANVYNQSFSEYDFKCWLDFVRLDSEGD